MKEEKYRITSQPVAAPDGNSAALHCRRSNFGDVLNYLNNLNDFSVSEIGLN